MSRVQMTSELRPSAAGSNEVLLAGAVAGWAAGLPADARITAMTATMGHQRDPYTGFVGLRASWTEDRPDLPGATVTYGEVRR